MAARSKSHESVSQVFCCFKHDWAIMETNSPTQMAARLNRAEALYQP
jgi:hypothetical protein